MRPIRFEMVDEKSPPRGGGNKWRATMGGLASESRPWLDQFRKRERERERERERLQRLFIWEKKSIFPVLDPKEKR